MPTEQTRCPCGSGREYDGCCGPIVRNERPAGTAEQLMRSRYTAYVRGDLDHLFRTWHPRTRPDLDGVAPLDWQGLQVLDVVDGGVDDTVGVVEFVAHYRGGALHERSRFTRRAGRWVYVDGEVS